ncbi:MAG: YafY family transcriptional regulator [Solimicrobium sp.]|jgi:predicted DNA-binding transcriptional regulator YafY|nr:YafY family transcriptional regulator [Solimicrobium sp.]
MSRSQRLLNLIQILRRHRFPVTGTTLAAEVGISLRTLYRDIATLQEQGANIDSEPGLGYILRPGFMLPPLMFSEEEIEALVLGSRWVAKRGDARLGAAARNALVKITAVLPGNLQDAPEASALLIGPGAPNLAGSLDLSVIRKAIRSEHKLGINYCDLKGAESIRTIWPLALGFFDDARVVIAWCELRQSFRHFRADRISTLSCSLQRYPRKRQALLKEWREAEGISPQ